jgi:hypothetical protein
MKQLSITLLLLAVTLLAVQPVAAGQGSPAAPVSLRLTTNTSQGDPGDSVTISGSGAVPGQIVFVTLSPQADSAAGALITEQAMPDANGTFSLALTIPATVPDGIYAIRAEQFTSTGLVLQYYWNAFTVGAGAGGPLLPNSGAVINHASSNGTIILGLVILLLMLSRGAHAAHNRV